MTKVKGEPTVEMIDRLALSTRVNVPFTVGTVYSSLTSKESYGLTFLFFESDSRMQVSKCPKQAV